MSNHPDHPRKGKEWRAGDRQSGVLITLIDDGEAYFFGGKNSPVFDLNTDEHEPVDSPAESAQMRAESAALRAELKGFRWQTKADAALFETLNKQIDEARMNLALCREVAGARLKEIHRLEEDRDEARAEVARLRTENDELLAEVVELRESVSDLIEDEDCFEDRVARLTAEVEAWRVDAEALVCDSYRADYVDYDVIHAVCEKCEEEASAALDDGHSDDCPTFAAARRIRERAESAIVKTKDGKS